MGFGLIVPLGLAIFSGTEIERNVRIRSNWEIVNQASGKVDNPARIAALQALIKAGEPLSNIDLEKANLSGADFSSADFSSANLNEANFSSASLNEANLSSTGLSIADLSFATLVNANLSFATLRGTNLSRANLSGAILSNTDLVNANLSRANLSGAWLVNSTFRANLSFADLSKANLISAKVSEADLSFADLSSAIFLSTNLFGAEYLTQQQLQGENAPLLCNVALTLNQKISVNPNRDCDRLPKVLRERYPNVYKTLEEAKAYVDEARTQKWDDLPK